MNTQATYRGCKYVPGISKPARQVARTGMYRGIPCEYTADVPVTGLRELACYRGVPFYVKRLVTADGSGSRSHSNVA